MRNQIKKGRVMLNYLEQLLKDKTNQIGKKGELLYAQWQLDKEYATQVLATIFNIFPHYTLHDRTHSEEILKNIGEILNKETFKLFSLTDLWLLLYAAFYHDIGMAAFAPDLDKMLKDKDFFSYLKEIQTDSKHHLHKEADYFEISKNKIIWKDKELSLERMDAFKFIMAEYLRCSHSKRSEDALKNDHSINPIPQRLRCMLGRICECHTESFEKVMELPDKENGFDYEQCHPRFIACLLRLGDLLDLDNNRISDIILRTVKTIPTESFFHIKKQLSISHCNINSKQIDITAECEEYKTADLASNWFLWLDKEITDQMKNWNQIVPNPEFGFLPTVGNLRVDLKDYDSIDGKVHPKFEIDTAKAIEMLQGSGLYSEPYQSIREILQNSVDATYLRIWIENKDNWSKNKDVDEVRKSFLKECQENKYAIKVAIDKKSSDDKNVIWHITISDFGWGMSKEDLRFLCKTGSSSHNKEKQKYLEEMPEWMRPSGIFGIGFQSIFLLTEKVHVRTRKYNGGDVYDIDLYNPTGEDNGAILLKTTKSSNFKIGTEVSFDFVVEKTPQQISFFYSHNNEISETITSDYDFIESESLDLGIGKLIDAIYEFSQASYQKIKLNMDGSGEKIINDRTDIKFPYYSERTNLAVSINGVENNSLIWDNNCSVFYRNQPVANPFGFNFLKISVNILGGNAKDVLTLDRNNINNQYYDKLYKDTISTAIEYLLKEKFSEMPEDQKPFASAFAYIYHGFSEIENYNSKISTEWTNFPIKIRENQKENQIRIGDLIKKIDSLAIAKSEYPMINIYEEKPDKNLIVYTNDFGVCLDSNDLVLLYKTCSKLFKGLSYFGRKEVEYILHKTKQLPLIDKNGWKSWFLNVYPKNNSTARGIIPCNPEYIKLAIKDDCTIPYSNNLGIMKYFLYPKMVSPYIIVERLEASLEKSSLLTETIAVNLKEVVSDKLIDFVFNHRKDESVTKDEIRATYKKFIKDRKSVINKINNEFKLQKEKKL